MYRYAAPCGKSPEYFFSSICSTYPCTIISNFLDFPHGEYRTTKNGGNLESRAKNASKNDSLWLVIILILCPRRFILHILLYGIKVRHGSLPRTRCPRRWLCHARKTKQPMDVGEMKNIEGKKNDPKFDELLCRLLGPPRPLRTSEQGACDDSF